MLTLEKALWMFKMKMNICFATDDNYVKPTAIAIMTVLLTNKDEEISIYILAQSLLEHNKNILRNVVQKYSPKSKIEFCFLTDDIVSQFSSTIKESDHVSIATYFRLYIPSLIPKDIDRILYLDGDIICTGSLSSLYETNLEGFSMAAVPDERTCDTENFERLNYPLENGYAAAGVLLINVNWWLKNNVQQKTLEFIHNNKKICLWHDQDALNKILNGTVKFCHIKYNVYEHLYENENNYPALFNNEIKEAIENPVIIHFCSGRKPWTFESRCPFTATWLKLYKQLFGKKCRLTHRYKGKTKFLWSIKRILHKLEIKKYEEFDYSKGYREIINKIEIKILGE